MEKNVHIKSRLEMDNDVGLGIEVAYIENKGRGVKVRLGQLDLRLFYLLFQAVRAFSKGEFIVEFAGHLIDNRTAKHLEEKYSMDKTKGCYMYYYKYKGKQYW